MKSGGWRIIQESASFAFGLFESGDIVGADQDHLSAPESVVRFDCSERTFYRGVPPNGCLVEAGTCGSFSECDESTISGFPAHGLALFGQLHGLTLAEIFSLRQVHAFSSLQPLSVFAQLPPFKALQPLQESVRLGVWYGRFTGTFVALSVISHGTDSRH